MPSSANAAAAMPAFMSHDPRPQILPSRTSPAERIDGPSGAGGDDVEMAVEVDERMRVPAGPGGDNIDARVRLGMFGSPLGGVIFDREAEAAQPIADEAGAFLVQLPWRIDGGEADQIGGEGDGFVGQAVDGGENAVGDRWHWSPRFTGTLQGCQTPATCTTMPSRMPSVSASGPRRPARGPRKTRRRTEPSGYGFLTVGQTARILGVSPSTLRLWENVGLVSPVRSNGRYRLYSPELLKVLKRIKYLRDVQRLNVPGIKRELKATSPPRTAAAAAPPPLGPLLRRMRQRRSMALTEAARAARISAGFLSSLERAQANASVATLQRLATAYGTTVMELFQTPPHHGRLVKPNERRVLEVVSGVRMELLSSGAPMLQSMLFRVAPLSGSDGSYSHQGEEFIYMISGTLEIWLDELHCFVLQAGDSFWFESTHGHRWFNPGDTEAALLWINTPPTF